MCEYCTTDMPRNTYHVKADNYNDNIDSELTLKIDDLYEGLLVECIFNYYDEHKKEIVPMGLICKTSARYCPWCGRKLGEEND